MDVFTSTPACKGGRAKALERSRGKRFVNDLKRNVHSGYDFKVGRKSNALWVLLRACASFFRG